MTHDPGELPDVPDSWFDTVVISSRPLVEASIPEWLAIHGAVVLASTHPEMIPETKKVLDRFTSGLEVLFESYGLEPPEGGWRAFYPR